MIPPDPMFESLAEYLVDTDQHLAADNQPTWS